MKSKWNTREEMTFFQEPTGNGNRGGGESGGGEIRRWRTSDNAPDDRLLLILFGDGDRRDGLGRRALADLKHRCRGIVTVRMLPKDGRN